MPRMSDSLSVGANSTSANVVAGLLEEFITRRSKVRVMATSSATGVRATYIVGRKALQSDQAISFANRFPVVPDDQIIYIGIYSGRQLLTFRNTTGGALTVVWSVDVDPV